MANDTLIIIATYNERENILDLLPQIWSHAPAADVLVVDDNSPDGTADAIEALGDPRVSVHRRPGKLGYGTAFIEGFHLALDRGYRRILSMDADLSHEPKELPVLLAGLETHGVVLGSRYYQGVRVYNWAKKRLILSLFANEYVRVATRMPYCDCTSGYRAYRREALESINLDRIHSNGYSFLVEILYAVHRGKTPIAEHPIIFQERREGHSKMSGGVIFEAIFMPWRCVLRGLKGDYRPAGPSRRNMAVASGGGPN